MPVGHFLLILISITFLYPALHPNDKDTSMLCRVPTHFEIKNLSTSQFREILLRFGHCVETANHRAHSHHGGYVTLINATPYDWNLTSMHQNEMEYDFPAVIPAGTTHEQYINFRNDHADGAAEAVYSLVNFSNAASFSIQAIHQGEKQVSIQYHNALSSLNNPAGSKIDLGFRKDGTVPFVLSGSGTDSLLISSNPPSDWMQKSLSSIGPKTLREIAMPASHNSGMNKLTNRYSGVEHNTLTQSLGVYQQAKNGARYFDIRPVYRQGTFYTGHFSKLAGRHIGGTGTSIDEMIHDINNFNIDFPGELVILDVSHDMNIDHDFRRLTAPEWQEFYQALDGLTDLWTPRSSNLLHDLSTVPLLSFITPGSKSSIIIRLPAYAPAITGVSRHHAFLPDTRLPVANRFSNTDRPNDLSVDQIRKMHLHPSPKDMMFMGVWTLTEHWLHSINVANHAHSIIVHAAIAHRRLFSDLWPAMSNKFYPNLIQVDDIHNTDVLALTMAINNNFALAGPSEVSRRDIIENKSTPVPGSDSKMRLCSLFDRWAHFWNFYPEGKCYNPHPFKGMAKNAQDLAKQWAKDKANENTKANNSAVIQKDKEMLATNADDETVQLAANTTSDNETTCVEVERSEHETAYRGTSLLA